MQIVIRTAVAVFLIVLLTFAAVWAIVMPLTSDQGDTLTLHLSFPTPMSLALVAVERNALASDWTAIQIESNSQTEWRVEQEAGKSMSEKKASAVVPIMMWSLSSSPTKLRFASQRLVFGTRDMPSPSGSGYETIASSALSKAACQVIPQRLPARNWRRQQALPPWPHSPNRARCLPEIAVT